MRFKIGKSDVDVSAEGCVECGIAWSHGWVVDRVVPVIVGDRKPFNLTLHICAECFAGREAANKAPDPVASVASPAESLFSGEVAP